MSNPTPPNPTPAELARQVQSLQKELAELETLQTARRRRGILFPALMVTMLATFSVYTYNHVRDNFSEGTLRAAMARQRADLQPLIEKETLATLQDLLPVYQQEAMDSFGKLAPELGSRAIEHLKQLPNDLAPLAQKHAEKMLAHVFERLAPELDKALGGLPQDKEQELVAAAVAGITRDVQLRGEHLAKAQSAQLEHVLARFDLPEPDAKADISEHQRAFLHLLLIYADQQLLNGPDEQMPSEHKETPTQIGIALPR